MILPGTGRWQREALTVGARLSAHATLGARWAPSALRAPPRSGEDLG